MKINCLAYYLPSLVNRDWEMKSLYKAGQNYDIPLHDEMCDELNISVAASYPFLAILPNKTFS